MRPIILAIFIISLSSSLAMPSLQLNGLNQKFDPINLARNMLQNPNVLNALNTNTNLINFLSQYDLAKAYVSNGVVNWNGLLEDSAIQNLIRKNAPRLLSYANGIGKLRLPRQLSFFGFFQDIINIANQYLIGTTQNIINQTINQVTSSLANAIFSQQPINLQALTSEFVQKLQQALLQAIPIGISEAIQKQILTIINTNLSQLQAILQQAYQTSPNIFLEQINKFIETFKGQIQQYIPQASDIILQQLRDNFLNKLIAG